MERSRAATGRFMRRDRDRSWRSALLVTLLATGAFLLTSFDLHPHAQLRVPTDGDLLVFSGAQHPEDAPHVEAAGQASAQHCLACLLQLHNQADTSHRWLSSALTEPSGLARATTPRSIRMPEVHSGGSRAPPAV